MAALINEVWRRGFISLFCVVAITISCATASKTEREKKEAPQYTVSGRDPKAYVDAAAMLAPSSQTQLDDSTAQTILADLDKAIQGGTPWSLQLWTQLDRLRAVSMSKPLSEQLKQIALKMVVSSKTPSAADASAATQAFKEGNTHYEAGQFDKATESYRAALGKQSGFWDAWNNMALAEMHNNNNLVALFEFASLTKNAPKYTGAAINLSVCLERLGLSESAYDVATAAVREHSQLPMAQYNKAWFENSRGNYDATRNHLSKATGSISDYAVAKWLQTINTMEAGRSIGAEDMKALPAGDQAQPTPKIVRKPVSVAMVDAYAGDTVVAKIPKGSLLAVSEKAGDWLAFYWPVKNVKHRLWIHQASLGN